MNYPPKKLAIIVSGLLASRRKSLRQLERSHSYAELAGSNYWATDVKDFRAQDRNEPRIIYRTDTVTFLLALGAFFLAIWSLILSFLDSHM